MTKTEIEDYFNSNKKPAPTYPRSIVVDHDAVDTGPAQYVTMEAAPVPVFQQATPPQSFEREPAATAAVYQQTPQAYADQSRMQQLQAGIPPLVTPAIDYPMGPTIEITRALGVEEPQNGGPDQGGFANKVRLPENPNAWAGAPGGTVVRDSFGNAVLSGTGQPIGLPTQNPNYKAPAGGGKGADATVESAVKQIGGK